MEHNASQHWHQTNTILEATDEIHRIDQYDTVLIDYANFVGMQSDTSDRIRDLLDLTQYYHTEFGVHFEKRYAYRDQLHRVLSGDLVSIDEARDEARNQYAVTDGFGLPKLERMARVGLAA